MIPAPAALRLSTEARNAAPERPPFGLRAWSANAEAIAILLDGSAARLNQAALVASQIPGAATLPPSTLVVILGTAARSAPAWRRLLGPRAVKIARAPRCAALLALGYSRIGAGADAETGADVVWGYAPGRADSVDFA